ncbi:MAG: hypothetical protein JRM88_06040 [Nitrososphaerota archaeon]|nr:hypothetical protein [Nitrososphaerota archaeon]
MPSRPDCGRTGQNPNERLAGRYYVKTMASAAKANGTFMLSVFLEV